MKKKRRKAGGKEKKGRNLDIKCVLNQFHFPAKSSEYQLAQMPSAVMPSSFISFSYPR